MILIIGFSLLFFCKGVFCNSVNQPGSPDRTVNWGDKVVLPCTYETQYTNPELSWYRTRTDHSFQFVLYRDNTRSQDADFTQGRFSVEHHHTQRIFHLVISSARPEDSATYYCALVVPSGGTLLGGYDALIFGKGTYLEVEPKNQPPNKPSVFLMKNGTKVACLVKDFYPKNVSITIESSKKITEFDPTLIIAANGKYSAVKLGQYEDPDSVTCSVLHNNELVQSTDFELKPTYAVTVEPTEPEGEQQSSEGCYEPKVQARKVNMVSLTLLGLRVLFAKSIAINFLLTAKLLFF